MHWVSWIDRQIVVAASVVVAHTGNSLSLLAPVCVFFHFCSILRVGNFKPFMRFNLTWLLYLVYAIIWLKVLVPVLEHRQHAALPPEP